MNWKGLTESERFALRIQSNPNGCIDWIGLSDKDGYGIFRRDKTTNDKRRGKKVRLNRWVWERDNGPIPDGHVIRHTCDRPQCVNPKHLLLGTPLQNSQDMLERGRHPTKHKTHCKRGHEFTPENTIIRKNGTRMCRSCHNARRRKSPTI